MPTASTSKVVSTSIVAEKSSAGMRGAELNWHALWSCCLMFVFYFILMHFVVHNLLLGLVTLRLFWFHLVAGFDSLEVTCIYIIACVNASLCYHFRYLLKFPPNSKL